MSLLDDVSIVVTPNGYKAGTLYGVLPVPTEGSEKVIDGSFPLGTTAWTVGTGWSLANGYAESDGTTDNLDQNINLTINQLYKATITVSNMTTGTLSFRLGGTTNEIISISKDGEYTAYGVADGAFLRLRSQSSFNGRITNVSVKEYTASDMDVTRATAATRVDENGLVNYAQVVSNTNLVTNGDFDTDSDWAKLNGSTISGGVARVVAGGNIEAGTSNWSLKQDVFEQNKTYKATFKARQVSGTGTFQAGRDYYFFTDKVITSSFVEYSFTFNSGSINWAGNLVFGGRTSGDVFEVDNVTVKEVDRNNVPRIDYTGGGCPHILAEPQRTNLIPKSNEFSDSSYIRNGTTATTGFLSPDGTLNAYKLLEDNTNAIHRIYQTATVTGSPNTTISIYVKYLGRKYVLMRIADSTVGRWYDIENGVLGGVYQGTPNDSSIESAGNGWYRISITHTVSNQSRLELWVSDTESETQQPVYQGDTSKGVYLFGAQLEVGTYPTSYIPTSGSAVTRNKDQFTRDGIGSLINSTQGVLFGEGNFVESNSSSYNYFVSLSDGTNNNRIEIRQTAATVQFLWRVSGTYQNQISTSGVDVGNNFKFALNYSSANIKLYVNGNLIGTINSPTLYSANTLNRLAFDDGIGGNCFYGNMKQLQVYKTALTDLQIESITSWTSFTEMANSLNYTIY